MVDKDMNLLNQEQPTPPKALRNFQLTLGKYLRSPESETLPKGIKARRAQVYEELLINRLHKRNKKNKEERRKRGKKKDERK